MKDKNKLGKIVSVISSNTKIKKDVLYSFIKSICKIFSPQEVFCKRFA